MFNKKFNLYGIVLFMMFTAMGEGQITEDYKLLPSDGAMNDYFGYSVNISGDVALIGAQGDDSNRGAAYIFKYNNSEWKQDIKLTASDRTAGDLFGNAVAITEDIALIAAYFDDDKGYNSGSVYIFDNTMGTGWSQKAKLVALDGSPSDYFGSSVDIYDNTIIIGAIGDNDKGIDSGSAYVFRYEMGIGWVQEAKLTASDGAAGDYFGTSVDLFGNMALIGAQSDDSNRGAAYVFRYESGVGWTQEAKLTASDGVADDRFGYYVASSGDIVIIGAYGVDLNRGAVYEFQFNPGIGWTQEAKLIASDGESGDYFGGSLSLFGDHLLIGAHKDNNLGLKAGSAYVFNKNTGTWKQEVKLVSSDGAEDDFFGLAVSLSDYTALIGGRNNDDNGSNSGSAYVFDMVPTAVKLVSFTATCYRVNTVLKWETASELENAGYHLWRSYQRDGVYRRITKKIIPSYGGVSWGAKYRFIDTDVKPSTQYFYKLEDIDYSGKSHFHRPISP